MNSQEFVAALNEQGNTYLGHRARGMGGFGNLTWLNLSNNQDYPRNVCDVSAGLQGNDLYVYAITTGGVVWRTHCTINGPVPVTCIEAWDDVQAPLP
ncbi:hypothetical protein [Streptomyces sp. NPDC086023]|uniref:hypothetical protein n=1 Tax=Streptomyces sp. NPDC086023 TaxID=3365746 RepID=UPI0037D8ED97